jgi:hypothetical protein
MTFIKLDALSADARNSSKSIVSVWDVRVVISIVYNYV